MCSLRRGTSLCKLLLTLADAGAKSISHAHQCKLDGIRLTAFIVGIHYDKIRTSDWRSPEHRTNCHIEISFDAWGLHKCMSVAAIEGFLIAQIK